MMNSETLYRRSPVWLQNVLLNAHALRIERHRYGPPYRAALGQLAAMERWPVERVRAFQNERLRAIVGHAYARSEYYRQVMDECGVRPADIRTVEDLPALPTLTKEAVRARSAELTTSPRPLPGWLHGHTSGTTGTPLGLWYDRDVCLLTNAVDRQHKRWAGITEDDWTGVLLGRVVVPTGQPCPPYWRSNHVQRQVWFSSFHLSEETLPQIVAEMRRRRLRVLEGYPSTLFIVAQWLRRRGETLPLRAAISSSETLHAVQREAIEEAFACRLSDFYALAERVIFACECERHEGKHLAETFGYTEVVDEEGRPVPDGTPGYLVGTSLHNTATPMIRYRTGDVSSIRTEPCPCGRTARRIADVTTKAEDIVVTPDGRLVSPSVLTHPFKPLEQIAISQIVQERRDHLIVRLVPRGDFTDEQEAQLVRSLRERLGAEMRIEIHRVLEIPRERSGKFRWVISRVANDCAVRWEAEA